MNGKLYMTKLSSSLFWDMDMEQVNMDTCPSQIVQRVLEYGNINDWKLILSYYGLPMIVELCKNMRSLSPVCLSYICCISNTSKEEYRCYHISQLSSTPWNF